MAAAALTHGEANPEYFGFRGKQYHELRASKVGTLSGGEIAVLGGN